MPHDDYVFNSPNAGRGSTARRVGRTHSPAGTRFVYHGGTRGCRCTKARRHVWLRSRSCSDSCSQVFWRRCGSSRGYPGTVRLGSHTCRLPLVQAYLCADCTGPSSRPRRLASGRSSRGFERISITSSPNWRWTFRRSRSPVVGRSAMRHSRARGTRHAMQTRCRGRGNRETHEKEPGYRTKPRRRMALLLVQRLCVVRKRKSIRETGRTAKVVGHMAGVYLFVKAGIQKCLATNTGRAVTGSYACH